MFSENRVYAVAQILSTSHIRLFIWISKLKKNCPQFKRLLRPNGWKTPISLPTSAPRSAQHFSCQIKANGMITYIIDCDNDKPLHAYTNTLWRSRRRYMNLFAHCVCITEHFHIATNKRDSRNNSLQFDIFAEQRPTARPTLQRRHGLQNSTQFISSLGLKLSACVHIVCSFLFRCRNSFGAIVGFTFRVAIT